jgi:hypothetical protein
VIGTRIELGKPRGNDEGPKFFRYLFLLLFEIDGTGRTELLAGLTFSFREKDTMLPIDHRHIGNGLAKGFIDGLSHSHTEVPFTRNFRGAFLRTEAAARAFVLVYVSWSLADLRRELTNISREVRNVAVSQ